MGGGSGSPSALSSVVPAPNNPSNPNNSSNPSNPATPSASQTQGVQNPPQTNPATPANPNVDSKVFELDVVGYKQGIQKELKDEYGSNVHISSLSLKIDGKEYPNAEGVDLANLGATGSSFQPHTVVEKVTGQVGGVSGEVKREWTMYLFKQQYSAIAQFQGDKVSLESAQRKTVENLAKEDDSLAIKGQTTTTLPTAGQYNYTGPYKQIRSTVTGQFSYDVDFAAKQGSGKITAGNGVIHLESAPISQVVHRNDSDGSTLVAHGIDEGVARLDNSRGDYSLGFFGPNAEEVIGHLKVGDLEGSFGGSR